MPPRRFSRHSFALGVQDGAERLHLTDRELFRFRKLDDNRTHTVAEGETLYSIAAAKFSNFPRPAGLFWVVADFQPIPIQDPTVMPEAGTVLIVPSERTVSDLIFNESRRE
jgi:hypothetical protein